jgi:hypothetical protein
MEIKLECNEESCFWNSLPHKIDGNCFCTDVLLDFRLDRPTICKMYSPKKAGRQKALHKLYHLQNLNK